MLVRRYFYIETSPCLSESWVFKITLNSWGNLEVGVESIQYDKNIPVNHLQIEWR